MKKVEAIIRQEKLEELKATIDEHFGVSGMTVTQVLGCGNQKGVTEYVRGHEILTTLLPKIKVSFAVQDSEVEAVIDHIIAVCQTEEVGDGKIFIYNIEEVVRIRTKERGQAAI